MNSHMCRAAVIAAGISLAGLTPATVAIALIRAFYGPGAAAVLKSTGMEPAS
jgi:hypothetical protein